MLHGSMMTIHESIRRAAERQGLSGYALGKLADVNIRTVQAYLSGAMDLSGRRLDKLCAALGLELRPVRSAKRDSEKGR